MRFLILLLAVSSLAVPASAAERSFPVGDFDRIILSGAADVRVSSGEDRAVVAIGDEPDLDRMDIRVENGALVIAQKRGFWRLGSRAVQVKVRTPELTAATISGSGDLSVDRVRGPFVARISGAGDLRLDDVDATTLSMAISGSGTMTASGRCTSGSVRVSGSGNVNAGGLSCVDMEAMVSGSGNVTAGATGMAEVRITGSGNVAITGPAKCTTRTTGSGTVRCG